MKKRFPITDAVNLTELLPCVIGWKTRPVTYLALNGTLPTPVKLKSQARVFAEVFFVRHALEMAGKEKDASKLFLEKI